MKISEKYTRYTQLSRIVLKILRQVLNLGTRVMPTISTRALLELALIRGWELIRGGDYAILSILHVIHK